MKEKRTGISSAKGSDWKRVRALTDWQIRRAIETDPEARTTDKDFWKHARVVMPKTKKTITIRLDADLLEWLRRQKGYQTRINRSIGKLHARASYAPAKRLIARARR